MAAITFFYLLLFISSVTHQAHPVVSFTRSDFPPDFVFGAGTSAYQVIIKFVSLELISFLFLCIYLADRLWALVSI